MMENGLAKEKVVLDMANGLQCKRQRDFSAFLTQIAG